MKLSLNRHNYLTLDLCILIVNEGLILNRHTYEF